MKREKYFLDNYPLKTTEKLRYSDIDIQGHMNNALYLTLIEAARVEIIFEDKFFPGYEQIIFMIAHISIDYLSEVNWPGSVKIGTKITYIGNSSFVTEQVIFSEGQCAAIAKTVIVTVDKKSKKKIALTEHNKKALSMLSTEEINED